MANSSTAILGACGEHYVAAYLSRFQLIVALPRAGVPGCDLLVTAAEGGPSVRIQVKTGTDSKRNTREFGPIYLWHTSFKVAKAHVQGLWFAYISIRKWPQEDESPELFFVPGEDVVKTMQKCESDGDAPFFWMPAEDAIKKYRAPKGVQPLLVELRQTSGAIV